MAFSITTVKRRARLETARKNGVYDYQSVVADDRSYFPLAFAGAYRAPSFSTALETLGYRRGHDLYRNSIAQRPDLHRWRRLVFISSTTTTKRPAECSTSFSRARERRLAFYQISFGN